MTIEENRYVHQRLSDGCTTWKSIDDPNFSPKQTFQTIAFSYNTKSVVVSLPDDMDDVDGVKKMDPNDISRINITRDCE